LTGSVILNSWGAEPAIGKGALVTVIQALTAAVFSRQGFMPLKGSAQKTLSQGPELGSGKKQ